MIDATLVKAIEQLAVDHRAPALVQLTAAQVGAIRRGEPLLAFRRNTDGSSEIVPLDTYVPSVPNHKAGSIRLRERADFVAAVRDHSLPQTRIFVAVEDEGAIFVAIFDFHQPATAEAIVPPDPEADNPGYIVCPARGSAGLCLFTATYAMEFSPEWRALSSILGKQLPGRDFGEWIEEHEDLFVDPPAGRMATIALTMRGSETATFADVQRLANGDVELAYKRESSVSAGPDGSLKIPEDLLVRLPVFLGEEARDIPLKLRYRIPQGRAQFALIMPQRETLVRAAVQAARAAIAADTGVPVWHGHYQA